MSIDFIVTSRWRRFARNAIRRHHSDASVDALTRAAWSYVIDVRRAGVLCYWKAAMQAMEAAVRDANTADL